MIADIARVAFLVFEVVVLFNLLILVHELGHFLAARWRGLVVEQFGIWFGKPLWQKTVNGVKYSLGCIPAGGFVKLPQLASMEAIEGSNENDPAQLPRISALDKIIVAFAGPLFSFGLAVLCAVLVWLVGRPVSESELTTVVGYVEKGGPADVAGLRPGDRILEVDGHAVTRFAGMTRSVMWYVWRSEGDTIRFAVERENQRLDLEAAPIKGERKGWSRKGMRQVLVAPRLTPVVGRVQPGTPAEQVGLKPGDHIVAADGQPLHHPTALSLLVAEKLGQPVNLRIERGGAPFEVSVTPALMESGEGEAVKQRPRIGIEWDLGGVMGLSHLSPLLQIRDSVSTIVKTLNALFSPKSDIKAEHMSGPIGIMRIYYMMFESPDGWRLALWFSVVLNVNLAILNLLPLPVLDGGHILVALIEAVRRKPVNLRLLEAVQTACALLLIGYMLYVTFYDVQDLPWFQNREGPPSATVSPSPSPPP